MSNANTLTLTLTDQNPKSKNSNLTTQVQDTRNLSWDGDSELASASMQDGLVEVVGVYGALHLGQLQVGLASAVHLRQAFKVRVIETRSKQASTRAYVRFPILC